VALLFFAITLFVSAFLLFLVEPMIGKTILPRLGGAPQVWNTCMVFFQMALLAGYAYTHLASTRLKPRLQLVLHALLLLTPLLVLLPNALLGIRGPFDIHNWVPPPGANPIGATLLLLTVIVGLPFFVVATSAPLLQKWFAYTGHPAAKDPYFLYGASNLGSLLALVAYPSVIEPYLRLRSLDPVSGAQVLTSQPWVWTFGYLVLAGLVIGCIAYIWRRVPAEQPAPAETPSEHLEEPVVATSAPRSGPSAPASGTAIRRGQPPRGRGAERTVGGRPAPTAPTSIPAGPSTKPLTWLRRLRWVALAAVPSSLMLGVTTYITTDLSPIPLFWIVPLALYLLSFILVFARWPVVWTQEPHDIVVYIQPVLIAVLVFFLAVHSTTEITWMIVINVLAFFATALVCHGELAKDRPTTQHLTEYYLWMAVGGMVGGMFNGLVAPVLFVYVLEFGLAIFCACLLRPTLKDWIDVLAAQIFLQEERPAVRPSRLPASRSTPGVTPQLQRTLDILLPLVVLGLTALLAFVIFYPDPRQDESTYRLNLFLSFGLPLGLTCVYYARPLRFGLAIGAVMLLIGLLNLGRGNTIYADRSYFGVLRVVQVANELGTYTQLMHGTTDHGMNFRRPAKKEDWGKPDKDLSRLATTYYHRRGPAGVVMEKFNWFPSEQENTYWADARMPASILGYGADPWSQLVNLWSEPPYATIGLGTGTMASYARPYQYMDFYEIDNHVRRLSEEVLADDNRPCFTYVKDARDRGAIVRILMGDARLKMAEPYEEGGGPEHFYYAIIVDAFSSDAIPVHLLTREAFEMYFKHLAEQGILCVHTSNRHVDLVPVVADVAQSLGYVAWRGHDNTRDREARVRGHYTSEWVMVARKSEYLQFLKAPPGYDEIRLGPYWEPRAGTNRHIWTDDYSNLMGVFRPFMRQR
jgi:hypothetical protein